MPIHVPQSGSGVANRLAIQAAIDEGVGVELDDDAWYSLDAVPLRNPTGYVLQLDGRGSTLKYNAPVCLEFPANDEHMQRRFDIRRVEFNGRGPGAWQTGVKAINHGFSLMEDVKFRNSLVGLQYHNEIPSGYPNVTRGYSEVNMTNRVDCQDVTVPLLHSSRSRPSQARHRHTNWSIYRAYIGVWAQGPDIEHPENGEGASPYQGIYDGWVSVNGGVNNAVGFRFDGRCRQIKVQCDFENPGGKGADLAGVMFGSLATEVESCDLELGFVHEGWAREDHVINLSGDPDPFYTIYDENRQEIRAHQPGSVIWE